MLRKTIEDKLEELVSEFHLQLENADLALTAIEKITTLYAVSIRAPSEEINEPNEDADGPIEE